MIILDIYVPLIQGYIEKWDYSSKGTNFMVDKIFPRDRKFQSYLFFFPILSK